MANMADNEVVGNSISFAEIVQGRDSTVRVTDDGLIYAVDLVMAVTGKNRNNAGQAIRNLDTEIFHSVNFTERQLSVRGGAPTKLLSFQHAIELIMVLPGRLAKETRAQFAIIIKRYMAGDASLVGEIKANGESQDVNSELARASLPQVQVEDDHTRKRKALEVEVHEEALQMSRLDRHVRNVNMQTQLMEICASLCPDGQLDDQTRKHFKGALLSLSSAAAGNYNAATVTNIVEVRPPTATNMAVAEFWLSDSPCRRKPVRRGRRVVDTSDDSSCDSE